MLPHLRGNSNGKQVQNQRPFVTVPCVHKRWYYFLLTIACILTRRLIDTHVEHRAHTAPMRPFPEDALADIAGAEVIEAFAHGRREATDHLRLGNRV